MEQEPTEQKQILDPHVWLDCADISMGGPGSFVKWVLENCTIEVDENGNPIEEAVSL